MTTKVFTLSSHPPLLPCLTSVDDAAQSALARPSGFSNFFGQDGQLLWIFRIYSMQ